MKAISGFTGGGGAVARIIAGTGVSISPSSGIGIVTINTTLGTGVMLVDGGICSTYRCGVDSSAAGSYSFSGGGQCNAANGNHSFIGGGFCNYATACGAVLGGFGNSVSAPFSSATGCNINACNACTFYSNNLCACGNSSSITANVTCLTNGLLVCSGVNGRLTNAPANAFGSFWDTTTQTSAGNVNVPMKFNATDLQATNGISIQNDTFGNPTKIVAAVDGVYDLQFSAQISRSSGGTKAQVYIWLSKEGVNVPESATELTLANNADFIVAAWNFFIPLTAGQYTQLYWRATDPTIQLLHNTTIAGVPDIPSVIITLAKVGELP